MFKYILSVFFVFMLSSCNTVEGVGEDVEYLGESIEDSVERNRNY